MVGQMKKAILVVGVIALGLFSQTNPFPKGLDYPGVIKPTNVTQTAMNSSVQTVYNAYKSNYLKSSSVSGQWYIESLGNGGSGNEITISEAHGYGMIVFALMAGYDANAKAYFDGMYHFYSKNRSNIDNNLMAWLVDAGETSNTTAATDGDMDIAYALLLAHDQWGSAGSINYLSEAQRIIAAIKDSETNLSTKRILLGDWQSTNYNTRSSDWMTGHLRAYKTATGDTHWDAVATEVYQCISEITSGYASSTGLMPDFITGASAMPDANSGGTGESGGDRFYYNACRYPWRITMDYYHHSTASSKAAASKLMDWATVKTGNDPTKFYPGYTLAGNALSTAYTDGAFSGPIVVASTVDSKYQNFLNDGWIMLRDWNNGADGVYGDAIRLLSMLVISGNWWAPGEPLPGSGTQFTITASAGSNGTISPSGAVVVDSGSAKIFAITPNSGYKVADVLVGGSSVGAVTTYTFSNVNSNKTIAASFTPIQYTISANAGSGGSISPSGSVSVNHGTNSSFTISPNSGFVIDSVIVDGSNQGKIGSYTFSNVTSNHSIRTVYRELFSVTATSSTGGTISPSGTRSVEAGGNQSYTISANTGYTIDEVFVDGASEGVISNYNFTNISADHTIDAQFVSVPTYTITATAATGATISPSGTVVVTEGDSQAFTISTTMGYAVDNVVIDGANQGVLTDYTFSNVSGDHTILVETRVVPTYDIVASAGTGGAISPNGTVAVSESMDEVFTITAANGYDILSVVVDGADQGAVSDYTFSNVTANHTIAATFEVKTYDITASAGSNGSISPSGVTTVNHGASETYTFTPTSGYVVDSVKVDGSYVGSSTSYTIANTASNHTISVTFRMPVYEITATSGADGSISPSGLTSLSKGDNQTYTMTASNGYRVDSVFVDDAYVGNDASFTFTNVLESHTIHATFKFSVPTVYITNSHGGYVDLDDGSTIYVSGEYEVGNPKKPQNFHFVAEAGYQLDSILVDGSNQGNSEYYSQKVQSDVTMEGFFSPTGTAHTLSVSTGTGGSVTPSGSIEVANGDDVVIAITPDFGYVIDDVVVGGASQGPVTSYTFTNVTGDGTLVASFKTVAKHTISATSGAGGSISPLGDILVNDGDDKAFTIATETGWLIDKVMVDGADQGTITDYTFNGVTTNHSIQAIFKEVPKQTITALAGVGGTITPSGAVEVTEGGNQAFTIAATAGYIVDSVLVDGVDQGAISSYDFTNVTATHTIEVVLKETAKHIVVATAGAGGSISPIGNVEVSEGADQLLLMTPLAGYVVKSVLVDGIDQGAVTEYTFSAITGAHTIDVQFDLASPIGTISQVNGSPFTVLLSQNPMRLADTNVPNLIITGDGTASVAKVDLVLYDAVGNNLFETSVSKYSSSEEIMIPVGIARVLTRSAGSYVLFVKIEEFTGRQHLHQIMVGVQK